jgi:hypothetical protein
MKRQKKNQISLASQLITCKSFRTVPNLGKMNFIHDYKVLGKFMYVSHSMHIHYEHNNFAMVANAKIATYSVCTSYMGFIQWVLSYEMNSL